jgi:carbamoyl-phosphate synthase large subunit
MNVLITSASRKVALVDAFRRALAAEGGGQVLAGDTSAFAAALYRADRGILLGRNDEPSFVDDVLGLCVAEDVRLVVPTRDEELPTFARARQRFAAVGVMVLVPTPDVVETCQNKRQFVAFCNAHGFPVPRTYEPHEIDLTLLAPLFVRPSRGKGGRGLHVRSAVDLKYALNELPDPLIQECVEGREYTVDLFADFDRRVISVVPRERIVVFGGESFVSRTVRNTPLMELATSLAGALGLVGHNTIQCFVDSQERIHFIEVNPRYGGAANLSFAAGAPTPLYAVQLALGRHVPSHVGDFEDDRIMLRYTEDLFLSSRTLLCRPEPNPT